MPSGERNLRFSLEALILNPALLWNTVNIPETEEEVGTSHRPFLPLAEEETEGWRDERAGQKQSCRAC